MEKFCALLFNAEVAGLTHRENIFKRTNYFGEERKMQKITAAVGLSFFVDLYVKTIDNHSVKTRKI